MRKILDYLKALGFFAMLALLAAWFANRAEISVVGKAKVIDGDSLVVEEQEVRLKGIDAPEFDQTCGSGNDGAQQPCGQLARKQLQALVGEHVRCEGWEFDKYDRLLARCHGAGSLLNATMVEQGWAVSYGDYEKQEAAARKAKRGIWAGEFENPGQWRKNHRNDGDVDWLSWLRFW